MFDRDLFLSLCKAYAVEFSEDYATPMYREDDGMIKTLYATACPLMSSDDSEATSIYGHVKKGTV